MKRPFKNCHLCDGMLPPFFTIPFLLQAYHYAQDLTCADNEVPTASLKANNFQGLKERYSLKLSVQSSDSRHLGEQPV